MAKRRTWRWVTRYLGSADVDIWPDETIPRMESLPGGWSGWLVNGMTGGLEQMHSTSFWNLTGLTIPTDHPVKVEFSAKVVE